MAIELLDIDDSALYFDQPLAPEARDCLEQAAENYGDDGAEPALLRAYFLAPEHFMVLVALYRYYYYQHRLADAWLVAQRVLRLSAQVCGLPSKWQELNASQLPSDLSINDLRFYLLALKGGGYLQLRLGELESGISMLEKLTELDPEDKLGGAALLEVVRNVQNSNNE